MQNSQQPSINEIRVGGNTHPLTLSGYIHTSLNSFDKTCIVAVGPKAISTAMKAVAVARLNIAGTGTDIIAKPEFADIVMDDIKVNGQPLNSEGKEIVSGALEMAVVEGQKVDSENSGERVHVGMKIFLEQVKRVVESIKPTDGVQTRINSGDTNAHTGKHGKNPAKNQNKPRKRMTDEELFMAHVGGKKAKSVNSHGIPRV